MSMNARSGRSQIIMSSKHCASLVARLAANRPADPSQVLFRREYYRWALEAPAAIRYQTADGSRITVDAFVVDLSAAGIGLQCLKSVPTDLPAEVFVSAEGQTYSATIQVTHCTARPGGFKIGCRFVVREG